EEISVVVDVSGVARREPPVAVHDGPRPCVVRAIPAHDAGTPDLEFAALSDLQRCARRELDDSDHAARKGRPDRLRLSRSGQRRPRDSAADLAHAVTLTQRALEGL